MTGMHLTYTFHVQGSPVSNECEWIFQLPTKATLVHISAVGSNAHDSTLDIGLQGGDTDGILQAFDIGTSDTPSIADKGDFNGALVTDDFYQFKKTDKIRAYVDGSGSTAIDDPTVVLTFLEG